MMTKVENSSTIPNTKRIPCIIVWKYIVKDLTVNIQGTLQTGKLNNEIKKVTKEKLSENVQNESKLTKRNLKKYIEGESISSEESNSESESEYNSNKGTDKSETKSERSSLEIPSFNKNKAPTKNIRVANTLESYITKRKIKINTNEIYNCPHISLYDEIADPTESYRVFSNSQIGFGELKNECPKITVRIL